MSYIQYTNHGEISIADMTLAWVAVHNADRKLFDLTVKQSTEQELSLPMDDGTVAVLNTLECTVRVNVEELQAVVTLFTEGEGDDETISPEVSAELYALAEPVAARLPAVLRPVP